ncbi:MAG TPA: DUF2062 domain-containing protein [Desulfobacteria bacterium]|nr:DUF2062 domain-containing protein [Desulfobacteria bacterium]
MRFGRYFKYQYYKMIRVKDTPSKVAQGAGLGFALDFAIPIPFLSIFIAFIVARILKINSLAAVMSATSLKPFFPAIVYLNYKVKFYITAVFPSLGGIALPHAAGTSYFEQVINTILAGGVPYIFAGIFNGLVIFILSYFTIFHSIKTRIRKVKLKKAKAQLNAE